MSNRSGGRSCRKWGLGDRQGETKVVPGLAKSQATEGVGPRQLTG